jgi:hypothetical protein
MIPSGTKFVGINPNFPTAERKSAQNNAAQEVYTIEEILESATLQQVSDAGGLDNGSTIRQGSVSRLGLTGIEQVCSNEKMIQWVDGREVYYSSENPIVHVNSINDDIPNEFYDETLGIVIGSRYTVLNTGITYICTDATEDNAVWLPMAGEYTPILSDSNGAVLAVSLNKAFYSISNGIVDVTIYVSVDVDFSLTDSGFFKFTLPFDTIGDIIGSGSISSANQCNVAVYGTNVNVSSKDLTFIENGTKLVAKFTYQAY